VQLCVALEVCLGKISERWFSSLGFSFPTWVSALRYSGPNLGNFFAGQETRKGRVGANRYSSRTSTDSAFPEKTLRPTRSDSQGESAHFGITDKGLPGRGRSCSVYNALRELGFHVDAM
jgi:hypothetical protein